MYTHIQKIARTTTTHYKNEKQNSSKTEYINNNIIWHNEEYVYDWFIKILFIKDCGSKSIH